MEINNIEFNSFRDFQDHCSRSPINVSAYQKLVIKDIGAVSEQIFDKNKTTQLGHREALNFLNQLAHPCGSVAKIAYKGPGAVSVNIHKDFSISHTYGFTVKFEVGTICTRLPDLFKMMVLSSKDALILRPNQELDVGKCAYNASLEDVTETSTSNGYKVVWHGTNYQKRSYVFRDGSPGAKFLSENGLLCSLVDLKGKGPT